MSGGSMGYIYCTLQEYEGYLCDYEMDDLLKDFCKVLHDAEWMHSGDISEEKYQKTLNEFKSKWFSQTREERLKKYIDEAFKTEKEKCIKMIGG